MDIIQKRFPTSCLSSNWCITCKPANEDMNHIFIHCPKAQKSYGRKPNEAIGLFMQDTNIKAQCLTLCNLRYNSTKDIIRFNITATIIWVIWLDRNNLIFNDKGLNNLIFNDKGSSLLGTWKSTTRTSQQISLVYLVCPENDAITEPSKCFINEVNPPLYGSIKFKTSSTNLFLSLLTGRPQ